MLDSAVLVVDQELRRRVKLVERMLYEFEWEWVLPPSGNTGDDDIRSNLYELAMVGTEPVVLVDIMLYVWPYTLENGVHRKGLVPELYTGKLVLTHKHALAWLMGQPFTVETYVIGDKQHLRKLTATFTPLDDSFYTAQKFVGPLL